MERKRGRGTRERLSHVGVLEVRDGSAAQLGEAAESAHSPMLQMRARKPRREGGGAWGRMEAGWNGSSHFPHLARPAHSGNDSESELSIQEVMGREGEGQGVQPSGYRQRAMSRRPTL